MKDVIKYIETENKKYPMVMNLNVLEVIQENYGTIEKWIRVVDSDDDLPKIKDLKVGLRAMINEAIDIENDKNGTEEPLLTDKQVGRILSEVGLAEITEKIVSLSVESTKSDEEPKNE